MEYTKKELLEHLLTVYRQCEGNRVPEERAMEGCAGLEMYEEPIFGIADAADPLFEKYKEPAVIGGPFMTPREWLPEAQTVISFFLPFQERVRASNRGSAEHTSNEWLHARIDGQRFLNAYTASLRTWFEAQGVKACVPSIDLRFKVSRTVLPEGDAEGIHFASAWSERHAAYAAGLGTFSLTRGLISEKGMAGRYGSILISEKIEADPRPYEGIYDYCIRCGACIRNCPVGAISLEHGKNQRICKEWVEDVTMVRYKPYYGCGKCQVGVPCEARNPLRRKK